VIGAQTEILIRPAEGWTRLQNQRVNDVKQGIYFQLTYRSSSSFLLNLSTAKPGLQ
jgi:hypothetical protein